MNKEQAQLVAQEMKQVGFSTFVKGTTVIIGLKRFVSVSEVRSELDRLFEGIEFGLSRVDGEKVRVS
jgi:hypothetical protein